MAGADRGRADENDASWGVLANNVAVAAERDACTLAAVALAARGIAPVIDSAHSDGPVLVGISQQQLGIVSVRCRGRRRCPTRQQGRAKGTCGLQLAQAGRERLQLQHPHEAGQGVPLGEAPFHRQPGREAAIDSNRGSRGGKDKAKGPL